MVKKDDWTFNEFFSHYKEVAPENLMPTISHDVRNQLSTIVGYLELMYMDETLTNLTEADKRRFIETMLERAHTISLLLDASTAVDQNHRGYPQA